MSRHFVNLALRLILAAGCLPLAAQTYTLQAFTFPHEPHADTVAMGINNRGAVVGYTNVRDTRFINYGVKAFKRDANGVFERPVDNSNATNVSQSYATGINDHGDIVGFVSPVQQTVGFLLSQGVFTEFSVQPGDYTVIFGINNKGDFVGASSPIPVFNLQGFISINGVLTQPQFRGATYSAVYGIAADDSTVGEFITKKGGQAFLRGPGGQYKIIQIPDAVAITTTAINNVAHKIVGSYYLYDVIVNGYKEHGFVYDYIADVITTVDWPSPYLDGMRVTGINSHGVITGYVKLRAHPHSFSFIGTPQ